MISVTTYDGYEVSSIYAEDRAITTCACVVYHQILYYTLVYYSRNTYIFVMGGIWSKDEPPQGIIYSDFIFILRHVK